MRSAPGETAAGTRSYEFDGFFNRTSVADAKGNDPTRYVRNQYGYTQVITDAQGNTTTFEYDYPGTNNLLSMTDARGIVTRYEYQGNRLITATANYEDGVFNPGVPDQDVQTVYTYNDRGQVTSVRDPNDHTTYYSYDSLGQRTVITDALRSGPNGLGNATRFAYDDPSTGSGQALGRVVTTTDARLKVTVNAYDAADHLVRVTENYLAGQPQNYQDEFNLVTRYAYDGAGRRTLITDTLRSGPNGLDHVTLNQYDAAGRLATTTVNFVNGTYDPAEPDEDLITTYDYDAAGRLYLAVEHRGGQSRATRTFYDELGRVDKTVVNYDASLNGGNYHPDDPDQNVATGYEYDANGNQVLVIDTLDRKTKTGYDALNRPMTVTVNYDPGQPSNEEYNLVTTYDYDQVGNQVLVTNPKSQATQYDYDDLGRVITVTAGYVAPGMPGDADTNVKTTYTYDAAGNRRGVTDPRGHTTTYEYDDLNRVVTTTNPLGGRTWVAYDEVGNRTRATDARDSQTVYDYDSLYRLVEVRQDYLDGIPQGGPYGGDLATTFTYDALGNRRSVTDAETHATGYDYDDLNRVVLITNTLARTRVYTYDGWGDRVAAEDENQHVTQYVYDELGRTTRVEDAEEIAATYAYDGPGNRLSATNGEDETTRYGYDTLNRMRVITDALGYVLGYETRYAYDALGNRVAMLDAEEVETRYEYDDLNRLSAVTENYREGQGSNYETNVRTGYGYDPAGNRTSVTNALDHTTVYTYDALNRLVAVADPLHHMTQYGYDAAGNREVITGANQAVTHFVYDYVNRLTGIDYPSPNADVAFTYDKVGNRQTMVDGTGTTTYDYDELYRLESVTDGAGQVVGYTYDDAGNRHTMTYPGSRTLTYSYDDANRLDWVQDWDSGVYDYTFDDAHRLKRIVLPSAITSTYEYDAVGRLITLTHASAAQLLAGYSYELDRVGNRRVVTETLLAPVDLGLAMQLLPEERPVLYADGEFLEPGWLPGGPEWLRLPDLAAPSAGSGGGGRPDAGPERAGRGARACGPGTAQRRE